MFTIHSSTLIHAPVERVFAFVGEPANLPLVWPSLLEVKNVKPVTGGGYDFDWVYRMAGVRFRGHSELVEFEKDRRIVTRSANGIRSTFRWMFVPVGDSTDLDLEIEYDVPRVLRLVEAPLRRLNEHEAETVVAALKAHLERGAGARPEEPAEQAVP
jgi:uncharacterized protein YndB with AHSA1/START domain